MHFYHRPLTCGIEQPNIVHSMAKLLQAQTEMLSAQVYMHLLYRVYQLFPILLDKMWILQLMKTVLIDCWSNSRKESDWQDGLVSSYSACQLKAHLNKTTLQVVCMLTSEERKIMLKPLQLSVSNSSLWLSTSIEELRGMVCHQLIEESQSIKQLGIQLQCIARRAFPTISGKEQDNNYSVERKIFTKLYFQDGSRS